MADISKEIENFRSAVYGEEVRGSMISLAEKMNDVSEATEAAEKKRVVAETGRVNAEQTRVSQENDRVNAENERSRSEDARVSQENSRKSAEGSRVTAETGRTQAEKNRESQEGTRQLAESGRAEAEKVRVSQENERVKAETERADAEKTRVTAETNRINAEKKRQTDTAMAVRDCNTATDRANKAAQDAEDVVTGHGFILSSEKGAAGGVATLDTSGKVPDGQIPDIPAERVIPDSIHRFVTDEEKKKWNIDVGELTPTFTQADNRTNLVSKEKIKISLGKIMKWFADLKAHAFTPPVNNLLGTDANLALSAPMGKELDRKIAELNNKLKNTIQTEDQKVGMTSDGEGGNFWFMSPKGVRWEVDAVNETVRFFNYLTMAGFTIDQSGNMSVSGDIAVGSLNITLSKMLETLNTQTYCTCFLEKNTNEFSNFLHIDLTNKFSAVNLRLSIYHPPGHVVTNSPIPNDTEYLVYREVFYHNSNAVLVKLTQAYPETGKTWINFYNGKTWSGWKVI